MKKLILGFILIFVGIGFVKAETAIRYLEKTKYDKEVEVGKVGVSSGTIQMRNIGSENSLYLKSGVITSTFTLILPPDDGVAGQVMKTDGSGQLSFGDVDDAQISDTITRDTEWDTVNEIETATGFGIIVSTEIDSEIELENVMGESIWTDGETITPLDVDATGDVKVNRTKKVVLDDDQTADSYILQNADDTISFFKDGVEYMRFE